MSLFFFFSSRRRHTRWNCDWSSDVCSSDLGQGAVVLLLEHGRVHGRVRVIEAGDEDVGMREEQGVRAQLKRASRGDRIALKSAVVREQAHVELLEAEAAPEAVGGQGEASSEILTKVQRDEVEERFEEIIRAEVAAATFAEFIGRQRPCLGDPVLRVLIRE